MFCGGGHLSILINTKNSHQVENRLRNIISFSKIPATSTLEFAIWSVLMIIIEQICIESI